jgi:hypothetical protein
MTRRTLEYVGRPNPHEDMTGFLRRLKRFAPQIRTKAQRDQIVMRATVNRAQRFRGRMIVLFGRDIVSGDLGSIPAWHRIPASVTSNIARMTAEQRLQSISLPGLEETYLWEWGNNWLQDVSEADYGLITSQPGCLFRDPDVSGLYVPKRAYNDYRFTERLHATSLAEGERILAERRPKHYVHGADFRTGNRS